MIVLAVIVSMLALVCSLFGLVMWAISHGRMAKTEKLVFRCVVVAALGFIWLSKITWQAAL